MTSSTPNQQSINDTAADLSDIVSLDDTSVTEINLFRELLLGDQIAELADAREKLARIIQQIRDPEELTKLIGPVIAESIHLAVSKSGDLVASAIAPIIDASIQKRIQQDKSAIPRTLGPIISEAISNEIESSRDKIAAVLAPVISGAITRQVIESPDEIVRALSPIMGAAIKAQVKSHRDEVIDALYPVIGSTVARYIKNLFDSINRQLQNTFTIQALMHKIRARIKGVSEAQLMFTESLRFNIHAAFLIHQSGLLITHVHPPGQQLMESEMVAGMLTAIRSFVNEWIEQSELASEIDQIQYGTSKIILEPIGGFGYLVTVGDGEPQDKFITQMRTTSNYIGEHFGDNIREFDGNTSMVPEAINLAMEELIGGKFLFSMGLEFQTDLNEGEPVWEESREISTDLRQVFEENEISLSRSATVSDEQKEGTWLINDGRNNQNYTITTGKEKLDVYGRRVSKHIKRNPLIIAATVVVGLLAIFFGHNWYQNRVDRDIEERSVLALQSAPDLGLYRLNTKSRKGILQLSGIVPNEHLRQRAEEVVKESVGKTIQIENTIRPVDVPSDPTLVAKVQRLSSRLDEMMRDFTIDTRLYFNQGESQIQPAEMKKVSEIEGFLAKYPEMHLRLIGHCDTSGSLDANLKLGYERATSVRDTLAARGVDVNRLHAIGTSEPPPDVSIDGPAYLNRCVLFEPIHPPR